MEQKDYEQTEIKKNELAKRKEKAKKKWFSKFIIISIIIINIAFTFYVLEIFKTIGNEPVVLIGAWFAFTTGELWMLSSVKKSKIKEGVEYDGSGH